MTPFNLQDGQVVTFEMGPNKSLRKYIWRECYQKLESTLSGALYPWHEIYRFGKPL
jgi:hypothetical protein